jgi:hypothetical protein
LVFAFEAEYDVVTKMHEFVTFVWDKERWRPHQYDIWPIEWPVIGYADKVTPESKAIELVTIIEAKSPSQREAYSQELFAGKYIPGAGWSIYADGSRQPVAERTCNVEATERDTGAKVMLWGVLDGCRLPLDRSLAVFARIRSASNQRVELDAVRVLPR